MTKTRNAIAREMDEKIKNAIAEALLNAGLPTKDDLSSIVSNLEKKTMDSFKNEIELMTKPLIGKIDILERKNQVYEAHLREHDKRVDDAEQYSRRSCLRIYGVPLSKDESSADCLTKVKELFGKLSVNVPEECIDRAHRSGQSKRNSGSKNPEQAIIAKFKLWEKRVAVYRARKEVNDILIHLDLTPRRAKLFATAREKAEVSEKIECAFVDVNCRLGLKSTQGTLAFFNSEEELQSLL